MNHRQNAAAACTEPAVVEHLPDEFFKKIHEKLTFPFVSCSPEKACCNLWHLKFIKSLGYAIGTGIQHEENRFSGYDRALDTQYHPITRAKVHISCFLGPNMSQRGSTVELLPFAKKTGSSWGEITINRPQKVRPNVPDATCCGVPWVCDGLKRWGHLARFGARPREFGEIRSRTCEQPTWLSVASLFPFHSRSWGPWCQFIFRFLG